MKLDEAIEVAVRVTKVYEGGGVTWDFDGAGVSLGLLQWNIKAKTLQPMLNKFLNGPDGSLTFSLIQYECLSRMLVAPYETQMRWAKEINDYEAKKIKEPWLSQFKAMLNTNSWRDIEAKNTEPYVRIALEDMKWSGVNSVRSFCMFFDLAVQNGGMGGFLKSALSAAKPFLKASSKEGRFRKTDNDKAWLIACAGSRALVAYMSNPDFAMNVFKRKLGIVEGGYNWRKGELPQVNEQVDFDAEKYGVTDEPIEGI